jgi:hypothetical protein
MNNYRCPKSALWLGARQREISLTLRPQPRRQSMSSKHSKQLPRMPSARTMRRSCEYTHSYSLHSCFGHPKKTKTSSLMYALFFCCIDIALYHTKIVTQLLVFFFFLSYFSTGTFPSPSSTLGPMMTTRAAVVAAE